MQDSSPDSSQSYSDDSLSDEENLYVPKAEIKTGAEVKAWIERKGGKRLVRERVTVKLYTARGEVHGRLISDRYYD